jgi:hypothetical protein
MKKNIYCVLLSLAIFSCNSDDNKIQSPTEISNIRVHSIVGGAVVKWDIPENSDFTYVEVRYEKNGKTVTEKVSKYTDSLVVDDLINKEPLKFKVATVNEVPGSKAEAGLVETEEITPIKREPEVTNFTIKLSVDNAMIDTYTQEVSEGPKSNLVDGNPATYWHSAWSGGTAPLPHWIQLNFAESKALGEIRFWFRQNSGDKDGRPSKWGLEVSDDKQTWNRVWESPSGLDVTKTDAEQKITFDKNYESRYFRVMILQNGGKNYTHLGEISFYTTGAKVVDKEKEAEDKYYSY